MKPIRTIEVTPFLPPELECLRELAYNLKWTWDHETIRLFRRLDRDLWDQTSHNPALVLGLVSQERLNQAANDPGFLVQLNRIYQKHVEYMKAEGTWFEKNYKKEKPGTIAYFSAEFGLTEALPIYSGGLGILAGDHVKAASELGIPLVGVGIVYQQGYFRQYLNPDGWQQERYPINDFYNLPIIPVKEKDGNPVLVSVDFPGRKVHARIWKAQVGRVPLYLLDTNIPQNSKLDEDITDALYHADREVRIQQEIILGVGGLKALRKIGIEPTVCHMNEGHSAFLGLERIAGLMQEHKLTFGEAKEVAEAGQIFTTHTAVPAGIDKFTPELMEKYWSEYYRSVGISRSEFLALGRTKTQDESEPFSMANLAIELSSKTNAVSKLHGVVSRKLFNDVWKDVPEHEVPITTITNGVHARSWISDEMADLFDRYVGTKWSEEVSDQHNIWKRVEEIPDEELWRVHEMRRHRLVSFCRKRLKKQLEFRGATESTLDDAMGVLDPSILTIGFARRMATYKRSTLLMSDPERLAKILSNKERPVQIIMAGKAHPEDTPAKELIRQVMQFCRRDDVRKRFVFIEDYDMNVARWMVEGVDVWLNTPIRPLEASGTSGMKAAFNGGLNCSILDGWWDEAYEPAIGWAIGRGETYADTDYQDEVESNALYDLLEKEIVPTFYNREPDGRPKAWLQRMKASMLALCPVFSINRMVREYSVNLYWPAASRYQEFLAKDSANAKSLANWKKSLKERWSKVKIGSVLAQPGETMKVGDDMKVSAWIDLGDFNPNELAVQIYHGPIDQTGNIASGEVILMAVETEKKGSLTLFSSAIRYFQSGRHGFTVRVLPHHDQMASAFDTPHILWASLPLEVQV